MIQVRWHGRGGQGAWTAARLLGQAAALYENRFALAFPSFGPERRGAPVLGFTKIDDKKILDRSEVTACDFAVILDETLVHPGLRNGIREEGRVILNTAHPEKYEEIFDGFHLTAVDATSLALEFLGRPITNTAMLAALAASSNLVRRESLIKAMKLELKPSLLFKNEAVVKAAFDQIAEAPHEPA